MRRGQTVRIDGTQEEGQVAAVRASGDIVVDTGHYEVVVGPDAVTPLWRSDARAGCPACGGVGTTDGRRVCDGCGGTGYIVLTCTDTLRDARTGVTSWPAAAAYGVASVVVLALVALT